mgnify:CR=1 FL=1|jgi:hypothetical protein
MKTKVKNSFKELEEREQVEGLLMGQNQILKMTPTGCP